MLRVQQRGTPWLFDGVFLSGKVPARRESDFLRELGSYTLRDTPKPQQFKAPGRKPTIKQLKEARKGNGSPRKGNPMAP